MTRTEALERWRQIADGALDFESDGWDPVDLREWVREVAAALVATEQVKNADQRKTAVHRAVGLSGQHDRYAALRKLVEDPVWVFPAIDPDGQWHEFEQSETVRLIVDEARRIGLLAPVYQFDDKKARGLIRDIWTKRI